MQPAVRASSKVYDFVNQCVGDRDFRHPQSEALLHFLLIVREHMLDGFNEKWTLDDIFEPIETEVRRVLSNSRFAPLAKKNQAIANAKKWAKDFATKRWNSDTEKNIRVAEMAEIIWSEILDTEHKDSRPETIDAIKGWLRPFAPDYAKKGGRPKKKPSST